MKLTPLSFALLGLMSSGTTLAAELSPVVVNADFRPAQIETTASSISVIDQTDIQKRAAQNLQDVLNLAPNVNLAGGGNPAHYFQIRGIGERGQFNTPLNPSVGLMVDGIDYSRLGAAGTLFDVQQVEVLRGPQGTRFGANGLAGVINVKSNEPTNELQAHLERTIGNYNTQSEGVAVSGPLIKDTLLGRLAVQRYTSDGYIKNDYLNRSDTQNQDELTARGKLKWLVNDGLTLDLTVLHINLNNGYDAFNFENDDSTITDEPGKDSLKSNAFALKSTWKMNPKVVLESTITQSDSESLYSYDDDWTFNGFDVYGYSAKDNYARSRKNHSFEMRLLSSDLGRIFNNSTDWAAGVYYLAQDEQLSRTYPYVDSPTGQESNKYLTSNTAAYGQLDHHLNAKTTLIGGLRIEQFNAKYSNSYGFNKSTSETLYGGKLGVNYQISTEHLSYLSLSRGYKAGGVNDDSSLPQDKIAFDTETLWNLEAGLNSSLFNKTLKTRLSVFYAQRNDQQVNSSSATANDPTDFTIYLDNAAQGENYGLEGEMDWLITPEVKIHSSLGLLNSTFTDYTYVDPNDTTNTINLNGREQAHAPSYQYSVGAEFYLDDHWTAATNIEGKDAFYFSNSHNQKSKAYNLVNANLEYALKNWTVNLWAKNITDNRYEVRGYYFGIDPRTNYTADLYTQQGAPRTFGLTVAYDY
ncbi:TonB-dependent receptor [Thiosulfativibrio zosterae]|uniref:TonB-dependent receptor n=1 Tax=Thiosulfativibrio zosterae TaxID=2675053 RepID=A0A6F8PLR2_9GAMM|nr:TonB-dependent receptor [Thiosulfativibrio zosterae]BBP42994.1 TonB-dependent receptor [Thiosulfativibrio zosterae]